MTPREGLGFFDFFWISYARFGTRMKWRRTKTPARGQAVRSLLFSLHFSEEMTCYGSKNDFYKKLGGFTFKR
jgi:hypothetical protein